MLLTGFKRSVKTQMPFFRFSTVTDRSHYYSCYISESSFSFVAVCKMNSNNAIVLNAKTNGNWKFEFFDVKRTPRTKWNRTISTFTLSVSAYLKDIFLRSLTWDLTTKWSVVSMNYRAVDIIIRYYKIRVRWRTRINSNIHNSPFN